MNREQYLQKAALIISKALLTPQLKLPKLDPQSYRVTCGLSERSRSVAGQCFARAASDNHINEIFINPSIDDTDAVLSVLATQVARATRDGAPAPLNALAGIGVQHSTTHAPKGSPAFMVFDLVKESLGQYPHAALRKGKKDGTRQVKLDHSCGAVWRMSATQAMTASHCPVCGTSETYAINVLQGTQASPEFTGSLLEFKAQ